MEQKSKKIDVKIIIIVIVVIIAIVEGIVIFASNNKDNKETPKGLSASQIIGKWESIKNNNKSVIELYEGGTGKYIINVDMKGFEHTSSITWEIKDNILNISHFGSTTGYKLENETITTVDGKQSYNKVK